MDIARVIELYAPAISGGGRVGSGYRVGASLALTAAHVVAALPVWRADEQLAAHAEVHDQRVAVHGQPDVLATPAHIADLTTAEGRAALVDGVSRHRGGSIATVSSSMC